MHTHLVTMRLPNFLVVGAPKAGTTSMHRYLREHPDIYVADHKGLHYFTYPDLAAHVAGPGDSAAIQGFCQTLEEYTVHYSAVESQSAIGDNSPSYLYYANCIPRIQQTLGNQVRIIAMVRNPIDRAFSNYQHLVRSQRETLSFYDALLAEEERAYNHWGDFWRYTGHSLYAAKIGAYIEAFGRERMMVIVHDQLASDPLGVVRSVYRFLGVDDQVVPANIGIVYNRGGSVSNPLLGLLERPAGWKTTAKSLLPRTLYRRLRDTKDAWVERSKVNTTRPDDRSVALLQEHFRDDIDEMERLLAVDLTAWRAPSKGAANE